MYLCDQTHRPELKSWLSSANTDECDFPIQNLPFCTFRDSQQQGCIGVGIGDQVLNLRTATQAGMWDRLPGKSLSAQVRQALVADDLRPVMKLAAAERHSLRQALSALLCEDCPVLRDHQELRQHALCPQELTEFQLPVTVGDYSDFFASVYHATNVGSMFRPDHPLLPNYKWIPLGYHGRSSSIGVSGQLVRRPVGQVTPEAGQPPQVRPAALLDYELELGIWMAQQNELGETIALQHAEDYFFGLGLLNDWSARDLQKWEYQPLGPFLAKSFATTISPWIVTSEALAPFRCPAFARPPGDPAPLSYLDSPENRQRGGLDMTLEVYLSTAHMRSARLPPHRLSRGSSRDLYWTVAQLITHQSSNGCNLQPGDLLGSGTVSGRERHSRGCLLELTWDGEWGKVVPGTQRTPITLPTGEQRTFLADGDEVILTGHCHADGFRRIGFGTCRGTIVAAQV